jgi:hypothetical protein
MFLKQSRTEAAARSASAVPRLNGVSEKASRPLVAQFLDYFARRFAGRWSIGKQALHTTGKIRPFTVVFLLRDSRRNEPSNRLASLRNRDRLV